MQFSIWSILCQIVFVKLLIGLLGLNDAEEVQPRKLGIGESKCSGLASVIIR